MMVNIDKTAPARPAIPPVVAAPACRATDERIFDGGDTLLDDDIMRANWAVPWSDLMMIMFVLFAALLAAQTFHSRAEHGKRAQAHEVEAPPQVVEREKIVSQEVPSPMPVADSASSSTANKSLEPLTRINVLARSHEAVRESNLKNVEIALLDDQSVKVSVQGPMFFAQGKADLRPEVTDFLDRLAQIIKQTPYDIHIVGHTDDRSINTGTFPSNWELSLVRASRVARYLIDAGGIDPSRFMVIGRGEYEPVSANTDEQSRALNRRVEIIITRDIGKSQEANRQ
jgi:chemotaxis protein MotB